MAIAVPVATDMSETARLNAATREVERELQGARLKAVSANRRLRVRFNCPAERWYRTIEVTGVATTDSASNRCDPSVFPFPGPQDDSRATPEHDGPLRYVDQRTSITGANLIVEFTPDGTARVVSGGTPQAISGEATISITRGERSRVVGINGLGRVRIIP